MSVKTNQNSMNLQLLVARDMAGEVEQRRRCQPVSRLVLSECVEMMHRQKSPADEREYGKVKTEGKSSKIRAN